MQSSRYRNWILIMAIQFAAVGIFAINGARASVISDIPNSLNDALLDGTSLYAAKAILTGAIMVSAGLIIAMLRMPPAAIFIVLLSVLGALTAIGWADLTFLILAALIVMAMFGKTMTEWMQGKTSGAE